MANNSLVNDPAKFPFAFDHALDSGDLDQLLRLYDPEACIHKSDGSVGQGLKEVSEESRKLIGAKAQLHNKLRSVYQSGETALIIVDWVLELNAPDGKRVTSKGTATNVIRHTPEHGWRMLIANPQGAA